MSEPLRVYLRSRHPIEGLESRLSWDPVQREIQNAGSQADVHACIYLQELQALTRRALAAEAYIQAYHAATPPWMDGKIPEQLIEEAQKARRAWLELVPLTDRPEGVHS